MSVKCKYINSKNESHVPQRVKTGKLKNLILRLSVNDFLALFYFPNTLVIKAM